jgi:hypothetical protein
MDMGTEIHSGPYIAFVIPDIKVITMNDVVFIIHRMPSYYRTVIFAMFLMISAMVL